MLPFVRPARLSARRWRLRTGLLAPIVLVVPLFLAVTAVMWENVARGEAGRLVTQRQETALAGLSARLQERRGANETIVYLLSRHDGLGQFIQTGNIARLAQTMIVMQASLNLSYIGVYADDGHRLLNVGGAGAERVDRDLVSQAIAGHNSSSAEATDTGLVVSAAAAVTGSLQTAGVLVVGSVVPASSLRDQPLGEDVAVYAGGRLVDSSLIRADLLGRLSLPIASVEDVDRLNAAIDPLQVRGAGMVIGHDGVVVTTVPVDDLTRSSQQRTLVVIGGAIALLVALVLITVIQARAIARPLENLVAAANALVRGEYRRVESSRNQEVHALGRAVNHLADQLQHKLAELTQQATHDSLSGLPNRKLFLQSLEQALATRAGMDDGPAVLFLDLDSFKIVNDSLGHAAGDQLIVGVTERLRNFFRTTDGKPATTIARLGGDEFTILLGSAADARAAYAIAEDLSEALSRPIEIGPYQLVVSASIGVAHSADDLRQAEDMLRAADVAMYRAKTLGRGKVVVYERAMGQRAAQRLAQETELRQAIEGGALRLYYQPIVDLATGEVREVEALVRWHHPQWGLVSPAEFIPLAEETGLIVPLGRWVLQTACQQLRAWQTADANAAHLVMNVNLSARQLQQPGFVDEVRQILGDTGVDAAQLTLEITESSLMQNTEANQLSALAALGIKLAIDDFGTGYSSLARLSRLPIDTLKIDRSFVARLGQDSESDAVVQTIIGLAHTLGMSVTAEGIEQPAQAARLHALGCRRAQGYYFGRPAPATALSFGVSGPTTLAA